MTKTYKMRKILFLKVLILQLDHNLSEGHRLVYEREIPFELSHENTNGPQD